MGTNMKMEKNILFPVLCILSWLQGKNGEKYPLVCGHYNMACHAILLPAFGAPVKKVGENTSLR